MEENRRTEYCEKGLQGKRRSDRATLLRSVLIVGRRTVEVSQNFPQVRTWNSLLICFAHKSNHFANGVERDWMKEKGNGANDGPWKETKRAKQNECFLGDNCSKNCFIQLICESDDGVNWSRNKRPGRGWIVFAPQVPFPLIIIPSSCWLFVFASWWWTWWLYIVYIEVDEWGEVLRSEELRDDRI